MRVFDAATVRNVALVGHSGAGKTQLASALVFDAGAVNRLGKVDEGTTVTDYDEEAIARKHTLGAALASFEWNRHKVNLIDTPGVGNFLGDARAALRVAELAVVVVDAVSGVQVSTEKVWGLADEQQLPRLVVVNRLDRERASLARTLESMRATLGRNSVPVQLPIGEEKDFRGLVDLVSMKAYVFPADESGKATETSVPEALAAEAQAARDSLIEMVAEADDSLMEKFFDAARSPRMSSRPGWPVGFAPRGCSRSCARPACGTSACPWSPTPSWRTGRRPPIVPSPGRMSPARRSHAKRTPLRPWSCGCGRPSRIRLRAASRCSACCRACSSRTRPCTTSPATRPNGSATCWCSRARHRPMCPKSPPGTSAP